LIAADFLDPPLRRWPRFSQEELEVCVHAANEIDSSSTEAVRLNHLHQNLQLVSMGCRPQISFSRIAENRWWQVVAVV
jgi:hypothetical protein